MTCNCGTLDVGHNWECPVLDSFSERNFSRRWLRGDVSSHKVTSVSRNTFLETESMTFFVDVESSPTTKFTFFFPVLKSDKAGELKKIVETRVKDLVLNLDLDDWLQKHFVNTMVFSSSSHNIAMSFNDDRSPRDVIHSHRINFERVCQLCRISTLLVERADQLEFRSQFVTGYLQFLNCAFLSIQQLKRQDRTDLKLNYNNSQERKKLQSQKGKKQKKGGTLQVNKPGDKAVLCNGLNCITYLLEGWLYCSTATVPSDVFEFVKTTIHESWNSLNLIVEQQPLDVPVLWPYTTLNMVGLAITALASHDLDVTDSVAAMNTLVQPLGHDLESFTRMYINVLDDSESDLRKFTALRDGLMLQAVRFPGTHIAQLAFDVAVLSRTSYERECDSVFATMGSSVGDPTHCFDLPAWKRTFKVTPTGVKEVVLDKDFLAVIDDHFQNAKSSAADNMYKLTRNDLFKKEMGKLFQESSGKLIVADAPFTGLPFTHYSEGGVIVHRGINAPSVVGNCKEVAVFISLGMDKRFNSSFAEAVARSRRYFAEVVVVCITAAATEDDLKDQLNEKLRVLASRPVTFLQIACHGSTTEPLCFTLQTGELVDVTGYLEHINSHITAFAPVCRAGAGTQNVSHSESLLCRFSANFFIASSTLSQLDEFPRKLVVSLIENDFQNPGLALFDAQEKYGTVPREFQGDDHFVQTFFNCFRAACIKAHPK